jgi:hypothetical protein
MADIAARISSNDADPAKNAGKERLWAMVSFVRKNPGSIHPRNHADKWFGVATPSDTHRRATFLPAKIATPGAVSRDFSKEKLALSWVHPNGGLNLSTRRAGLVIIARPQSRA